MAMASGVVIEFDRGAMEREALLLEVPAGVCGADPLRWVLQGGEEHGMLAAFPPGSRLPDAFRAVGWVRDCGAAESARALFDGEVLRGAWDQFSSDSVD